MPSIAPDEQPLHVAVAVVANERGEILIARRPQGCHLEGMWEFPGGKLEPGEGVQQALRRELEEELGIRGEAARPLIRVRHRYSDGCVLLDVWRVTRYRGAPFGREGQTVRWVEPERLPAFDFPPPNRPICTAVRLPDSCMITPEPSSDLRGFLLRLECCLREGVRLFQLRARRLSGKEYRRLAEQAISLARRHGAQVLLNAAPERAMELGADGVHLSSRRLLSLRRRPLPASRWVAASCHDERELRHAADVGVDFALLSPVLPTVSHPGAAAVGWEQFQRLVEQVNFPVYALGGMDERHISIAHSHGAQGIAAIRGIWGGTGAMLCDKLRDFSAHPPGGVAGGEG